LGAEVACTLLLRSSNGVLLKWALAPSLTHCGPLRASGRWTRRVPIRCLKAGVLPNCCGRTPHLGLRWCCRRPAPRKFRAARLRLAPARRLGALRHLRTTSGRPSNWGFCPGASDAIF